MYNSRQSVAEFFFDILVAVICWGITLDHIHANPPFLGLEGGLEKSWSVCFPSSECPLCCLRHQGHILGVWYIVFLMT